MRPTYPIFPETDYVNEGGGWVKKGRSDEYL